MGAVSLVRQTEHTCIVSHTHNGPKIAAYAVVCGIIHKNRYCLRMLRNRLCYLLPFHPKGDSKALIHLRIHINRHSTAENQGIKHAAVYISGKNDFVSPLTDRQHHALYRTGSPSHHQKSMGSPKGIRSQFFRLTDHRDGMAQVIQRFHAVYIHSHALLPQKCGQLWISPSSFVSRHIKRNHPHLAESFQRFVDRRTALIQTAMCSIPPSFGILFPVFMAI